MNVQSGWAERLVLAFLSSVTIHMIYVLILSSNQRLCILNGLPPLELPTKTLYAPLLSPTRATCPAHLSVLVLITRMISGEEYRA